MPGMDGSLTPHKGGAALPEGGRPARIAPKLRAAIKLRIEEGLIIKDACARAGISEAGWHVAMKRPAVLAHYEATELAFIATVERRRKQYRARAIEVAADLMERAASEAVRMKAVEFFVGETRQPTVAVQINQHAGSGYIYRPKEPSTDHASGGEADQVVDGQAQSKIVGE